jgi:branched-chain amino acid transport system permease protein
VRKSVRGALLALVLALLTAIGLPLVASAALAAVPPSTQDATPTAQPGTSASPSANGAEALQGRLRNGTQGVAGVKITVTTADGGQVGSATTDDKGGWKVPVPGPASYVVSLDPKSLPKGVDLSSGVRSKVTVTVNPTETRNVLFPIGKSTRVVESKLDRFWQLLAEGVQFGLIIALAAVGLSLIFGTTGLTNFAHGELVTLGALVAYFLSAPQDLGLPFIPAAILAVVICGVLGGVQDRLLWRPLRRRGTGLIAMLVVTIGLAILLRYLFLYLFGGGSRSFPAYAGQTGVDLGLFSLTPKAMWSVALAVVVLLLVAFALLRTRIGKATRAVADNPALAASSGIDVERVIQVVWVAGAALAALAGILLGLAQQVNFQLGFQVLLLTFAAVTLGGLGTAFGALIGSLVVGIFTQVVTLVIPSELKNAGALAILILILLVRPQGILGRAERVG